MATTTPEHLEMAKRLLDGETAGLTVVDRAEGAGRVIDALYLRLSPLLGHAGVRALFVRSVKLTRGRAPCLDALQLEAESSSTEFDAAPQLVRCLTTLDVEEAGDVAIALYATFIGLLTEFIGEALVGQVLRRAFPHLDQSAPKENE